MVEAQHDKTNPCGHMIPSSKRALFSNLKRHLNVEDNARSSGSLQYSWNNFRDDGHRIMARLDRFYIFKNGPGSSNRKLLDYMIHSDGAWLDHCPISASIEFSPSPARPSRWKMNDVWLDKARPEIEQAWYGSLVSTPFFSKLKAVSRAYRSYCRRKALDMRVEEDRACNELSFATQGLQASPNDPSSQGRHGSARLRLQDIKTRKVAGKRIRARIRWKFRGDMISSEFFKAFREKPAGSTITGLWNSQAY